MTRCLCWAHVRRAFADALPVDVKDSEATKQGLMNYLLDGSCAFSADPERFPRTAIPVISRISGRVPAVGSDHTENVSIGAPIFKRLVFFFLYTPDGLTVTLIFIYGRIYGDVNVYILRQINWRLIY